MNKFILKNKLLATTAICAISMCANTVKAEEISILDILNNSTTKSPNISWEQVTSAGTDTIQIGDEYFKYTYTTPADYTEVKDKTENISVDPTEEYIDKYVGLGFNNSFGRDYGDIEKYVFSNNKVTATLENNTGDYRHLYVYGGAISNQGTIGDVTADFLNNSIEITVSGDYVNSYAVGGAIYNHSTIETITGDFIGNSAISTGYHAYGGAIYNDGTISSIVGDFTGNSATATGEYSCAYGGAIQNNATISSITGDFIGNSASSTNNQAEGGAIRNGGTITSITGDFTGNSATSTNGSANGGAIYNGGNMNITGNFINNFAISENSTAHGGAIYNIGGSIDISVDGYSEHKNTLFKGNYIQINGEKQYEAIYNATDVAPWGTVTGGTINFNSINLGSLTFYDFINGGVASSRGSSTEGRENSSVINFTGDGTGTFNLYNNIQNQKDVNFQAKYVLNMISPDDIHVGTSKYSYIQAQNININAALQMMLDVDLENAEMDRFEADNFTISATGSIDVTKFNIVTDVTGDIGTTTEVDFIVSDNATGLDKITNVTEAVGEVYTYTVTFNPDTGAFEFVSTGLAPEPVEPSTPAPEEVAPNQAPALTTNTTVAAVETVVAQIFDRDVTISADTNYGADTTDYMETSDGVNIHNNKSLWVKTFGSDDDVEIDNFNGTIDSEAYGVVGGVDSKVFTYDNGVKAAYGIYGAYVGGKQKYDDNKIEQKSGYLGVSASFRKSNLFSNFTLNGGYITSKANTAWGKDEFDTKVVSVANKTGVDIKAGNNWTITPAMYVAYTGMDTEDYTNKAGVKMENEFANVITLAPELKVRKGFNNGVGAYAKVSYKHYIYDSEVKADDVVLEEMSAKPYVEYGFGVEKNWADKSGYAELTRRDGGREGWNVNLGLNLDF